MKCLRLFLLVLGLAAFGAVGIADDSFKKGKQSSSGDSKTKSSESKGDGKSSSGRSDSRGSTGRSDNNQRSSTGRSEPPKRESPPSRDNGFDRGSNGRSDNNQRSSTGRSEPPRRESPPSRENGFDRGSSGRSDNNQRSSTGRSEPPRRESPPSRENGFDRGSTGRSDNNQRSSTGRIEPSRPETPPQNSFGMLERVKRAEIDPGRQSNNQTRGETRSRAITIDRAPTNVFSGSLRHQVLREEQIRRNYPNIRRGYYWYDPYWCDNDFRFRWYVYDCYTPIRFVCSPWYYYPHLPPYLNYSCVRYLHISIGPFYGSLYTWRRPGHYERDYRYSDLDYAIEDLAQAFERRDRRALGRLVPDRGDVHIYVDGDYAYSLQADEYFDLMLDNVYGTRTIRYEIERVRTYRYEAEVVARHEFTDPWGRRDSVYHEYRLEAERGRYVIRSFGTSYRRY